jgi:alkanesulfonate monooxygenase SsuD/methylene tetrahydromethanopterin reductase-like flavin-dependent oxidoreductase (luciferase family)
MGEEGQRGHDDRYEVAEDYMSVVYKLWEGSWADDAVVADVKKGVFTRPDRVRRVRHDGPHYKLDALRLSEPSLQRTPVLYQAGTSPAGRAFAARHAECVFMSAVERSHRSPGRRDPETCEGDRPRSVRNSHVRHDDGDCRADRRAGSGQARRLSPIL